MQILCRVKRYLFVFLLLSLSFVSCSERDHYVQMNGFAQGGTYTVKINLKGVEVQPSEISAAVDSILKEVDFTLSGYNKASILSRFNDGQAVEPNEMFKDIYRLAYRFYLESETAINVAAAPLFDIWGFGFTSDSLPDSNAVNAALAKSIMPHPDSLRYDGTDAISLNYNAIAQGYSCDLVADYLKSIGVKDMLVDIGEIYCSGLNPSAQSWSIGVDTPQDGNETPGENLSGIWLSNGRECGLVTSGNYRKYYLRDGKKYAHTIDARTGYPVEHSLLSATIVANTAAEADAYATYCMVLGLEESIEFINSREDLEALLIYDKDGEMLQWHSEAFSLAQ